MFDFEKTILSVSINEWFYSIAEVLFYYDAPEQE